MKTKLEDIIVEFDSFTMLIQRGNKNSSLEALMSSNSASNLIFTGGVKENDVRGIHSGNLSNRG